MRDTKGRGRENTASSLFLAQNTIPFMERRFSFMTYRQIEASRELRLWIGQVIIPAISVTAVALANPGIRNAAKEKLNGIKRRFQS